MCGICGILNFERDNRVAQPLLERMTGALAHRGPDDCGYFLGQNAALGHRRLSIIDLSGGKQPIFNETGSIAVVFNGEIYNYAELTENLARLGHVFRTHSDTETIVHAYEEYGEACVDRFRGMFAFALWDAPKQRLLLVRDRLGIKPLYYCHGPRFLAFASEIKALLEVRGVRREMEPAALDSYLSLRYVPGPRTMFRNIFKLQPGHLLVAQGGEVRVRKYWDIAYAEPRMSAPEARERFEHLLEESVRLRLIAEVPLGVFLSGGIDSSAILAVMSRIRNGERIKTFSVGYSQSGHGEDEANEFRYARMAARAFGAEHHEFRLAAPDFRDFVPQLVWDLDEPLADTSCIPLYFIARLAREHITVVLSGEGADEVLAGYGIYRKMLALERMRRLPLAGRLAGRLAHLASREKYRHYLRMAGIPLSRRYRGVSRGVLPELKQRLLAGFRPASGESVDDLFAAYFRAAGAASPLDQMLYVDAKVWLPDDLLLKADKMTMANALELRVPFLDHKLVEFAATLPAGEKLNGGTGKHLLRRTMAGVLPEPILTRKKKGFPVPLLPWLRGPLSGFPREILLAPEAACRRYFDRRVVEEIVSEQEQGRAARDQELWTLLIFEFWHRLFIEQKMRPALRSPRRAGLAEVA